MNWKWFAYVAVATLGAGCPSADVDPDEVGPPGPTVEFDPSNRIIPFPNNLLLNPMTGKLNLPAGCNVVDADGNGVPDGGAESATAKALREQVLNSLDGFGTFKTTINVTFTEAVDPASLTDRVHLYQIARNGMPVSPAESEPISVLPQPNTTVRFDAACAVPTVVNQVTFIPIDASSGTPVPIPLEGNSTYVLGITEGVTTADGDAFEASFVWAIVRSAEDPVTLDAAGNVVADLTPLDPSDEADRATLQGIDLLWTVHEAPLAFLNAKGHAYGTILVATSFNTQTITDPLDATIATSPAGVAATTGALLGVSQLNGPRPVGTGNLVMQGALGQACEPTGPLPCNSVFEVLQGGLAAKQYQIDTPNPLDANNPIPGPWADPLSPPEVKTETVGVLAFQTNAACRTAAEGCPTVIFQHGLGSSKTTAFAIASQLAQQGFNTVAIDAVAHDSRAKLITTEPARGCGGTPTPGTAPQCFAPFLSPNLAATRDNIRQTVVDLHSLNAALKACGTANCGELEIDDTKILYMGISLGGIMGSLVAPTTDIKAAVLNVPGVGWVDIIENTQSLAIRCSVIDGLIDAGILVGAKFNPAGPSGLCLGEEWKTQPGYRQFSVIGRWVLDPADPVNFAPALRAKRVLIQEVVGDAVVANVTTEQEAALAGLQPGATASPALPPVTPSAAIVPNMSLFVRYPTLPPDANTGFPGNTFAHASLLQPPAGSGAAGQLGTARLQVDAITFLVLNR